VATLAGEDAGGPRRERLINRKGLLKGVAVYSASMPKDGLQKHNQTDQYVYQYLHFAYFLTPLCAHRASAIGTINF